MSYKSGKKVRYCVGDSKSFGKKNKKFFHGRRKNSSTSTKSTPSFMSQVQTKFNSTNFRLTFEKLSKLIMCKWLMQQWLSEAKGKKNIYLEII